PPVRSNFENARSYWGDWMPTFPYYLDELSTVKFAANVPYPKGHPRVSLKKYSVCPHDVEVVSTEEVPTEDAVAANTPDLPLPPPLPLEGGPAVDVPAEGEDGGEAPEEDAGEVPEEDVEEGEVEGGVEGGEDGEEGEVPEEGLPMPVEAAARRLRAA
ncbi:hypothetical protein Naga_101679g2, partial [Nannochloropsis gaditana]